MRLHYLTAGKGDGDLVVLLHRYAETSHMWRPLRDAIVLLARICARAIFCGLACDILIH